MRDRAQVTQDEAEREDLVKAADFIRHTLVNDAEGTPGQAGDDRPGRAA